MLWTFEVNLNIEAADKRHAALDQHFPGQVVTLVGKDDRAFRQVCCEVDLRPRAGGPQFRSYVMVAGDTDGKFWSVAGQYKSMPDCIAAYDL